MGAVHKTGAQLDKTRRLTGCAGKWILRSYYSSVSICMLGAGLSSGERGGEGSANGLAAICVCVGSVPWMRCQWRLAIALEVLLLRPCSYRVVVVVGRSRPSLN